MGEAGRVAGRAAIEDWPAWNSEVSAAGLEGELAAGSRSRWKVGGSRITSRLIRVDPPREIASTGRALGIEVIHLYRIEARGEGASRVRTEESVQGLVARLLGGPIRARTDRALAAGLADLKAACERRAGA